MQEVINPTKILLQEADKLRKLFLQVKSGQKYFRRAALNFFAASSFFHCLRRSACLGPQTRGNSALNKAQRLPS